jgi:amino acid adenylation domain-containing protein
VPDVTTTPRAWFHGDRCHVPELAVHELFLQRARRDPDALAVRQWDKRISYEQLASQSAALAGRLKAAGVGRGNRVGIGMRRTPWLPSSELAVLMAGGAFVPLDLDQPADRLKTIVDDAGIRVGLVDGDGGERLAGVVDELLFVDSPSGGALADRVDEIARCDVTPVGPDDIAYIMYTSGSTGRPRGVMVSHRNLRSFAAAISQHLGDDSRYRLAAFAAVGFDVSVYEFFTTLAQGASLHLVSETERADPERLQRFLQAHRVTRVLLPPVLLPLLDPDRLPGIRDLMVGGEACDPRQVGRWAVPGQRRFFNWYGPTEATVAVTGAELTGHWDKPLPLGRPLPGCSIYLLDKDMRICAPGQPGELYVGGPQVASGYVSGPGNERFVPDPFRDPASAGEAAGLLYRTGDLASWDENGIIWFLGRADRQVQINGRRVELGEIEAVLCGHPRVRQAAVDISGSAIRAYVAPADALPEEVRAHCAAWLPAHMVPVSITALPRLPTTVNAKVDFAALRGLATARAGEPSGADGTASEAPGELTPGEPVTGEPVTDVEHAVAKAWASLLEVAGHPDPSDDFFAAGGDSLAAMRLASALRAVTGREVSAQDVLDRRTIAAIAAQIRSGDPVDGTTLPRNSAPGLSPAQRRLWFIEQFAPGVSVHNIVLSEHIDGVLDVRALEYAFEQVTIGQAALRWRLRQLDGVPTVTLADPMPAAIPVEDFSSLPADERSALVGRVLQGEADTPIALTAGPLWRIRLLRFAATDHVLVITVHHIVFDGWSQAILYRELGQAYQRSLAEGIADGDQLPQGTVPGAVTFADYTAWVLDRARRGSQTDSAWWERHLSGAPTVLDLPRDRPRPSVVTFSGAVCGAALPSDLAAAVTRLAASEGTTIGTVLLAVFGVLLRRLSGECDLIIGTPVADRGHAEFEDIIGFFIRILPLRLRVDDHATFAEHVRRCRDELSSARQHADAPLEQIVDALGGERDLSRNPLYQVMFNVYNFAEAHLELAGAAVRPVKVAVPGALVDLTLYVIIQAGGMRLEVSYNRELYDGPRIEDFLDSFECLLRNLVRAPDRSVLMASARPGQGRLPDWTARLPAAVPDAPGLLEQVRAVALAAPDSVAVQDEGHSLRYRDVVRVMDGTAAALRAAKVRQGNAVGVLAGRTASLPAVLLGVLATGARWVILDGELPDRVLEQRITAVGPHAIIRCGLAAEVPAGSEPLPVIDVIGSAEAHQAARSSVDAPPAERGYLSLTSGTTGEPKIIDSSEFPLVHFLNWYRAAFGLGRAARVAMLSGLAHDPLLRDMFTPLTCGGTLVVPPSSLLRDPGRLLAWLNDHEISVAHVTPQLVRMMTLGRPVVLESLLLVAVAGDQLTEGDAAGLRLIAPHARVVNFYGTTETPQAQGYFEVHGRDRIDDRASLATLRTMPVPVGEGIDGVQLLVMSACGEPAAVGELGEVVIRGSHLSNGYRNADRDTGPFRPLPGAGEGRVYRTGDLGRYTPSGAVILVGRADEQVKVRGFRVELGEVEAALRAHPDVRDAAVRVFEHRGITSLHAYVTSAGAMIPEHDVLRLLRSRLPPYAVPSGITVLPALPLTAAGKVNRAALPPPGQEGPGRVTDDAPEGDLERLVLAAWKEVLGIPRIRTDDNFFEIGGNSMAIIGVQARLTRWLSRQVLVVDLFRFPTIRSLAGHLAGGRTDSDLVAADLRGRLRRQRSGRRVRKAEEA